MKLKAVPLIILFILLSPLILFAQEIPLALNEVVALALRDNRQILLKAEEVKKAKLKISESEASLFPTLSFTSSWTDTRGYYAKDSGQATTQTTLKQYLYKGGKIITAIKQKEDDFIVAQALLDRAKLELALSAQKAFYTLLLASEYADLNKGILENSKAHLEAAQARFANGQASESDILIIKESLSAVEEAYASSLNQVEASAALLRNLLYLDEAVRIKPSGEFNYQPAEFAYDEAFLKAMKTRPEIRQYEAQEKADQKAIEIAKADGRPSIYASWDYYSRSHVAATTTRGWNDYNVLGLTFSWPIFDGWATKAKVEQAIVDLKETRLTREKTSIDIALELKNAYLDLKNALAAIKSAEAQISLYKDTLSATEAKYKSGIASSLDLNDAQLGYSVSVFNQKQALYDYALAKASFNKATGGL